MPKGSKEYRKLNQSGSQCLLKNRYKLRSRKRIETVSKKYEKNEVAELSGIASNSHQTHHQKHGIRHKTGVPFGPLPSTFRI